MPPDRRRNGLFRITPFEEKMPEFTGHDYSGDRPGPNRRRSRALEKHLPANLRPTPVNISAMPAAAASLVSATGCRRGWR